MNETRKSCAVCRATRTPLWRTGPAGPRSLCNACGIRYRKRKATEEGGGAQQQQSWGEKQSITCTKYLDEVKQRMFQRAESPFKKQRNGRDGGEVEEAAFLLMSLSCDPVFA